MSIFIRPFFSYQYFLLNFSGMPVFFTVSVLHYTPVYFHMPYYFIRSVYSPYTLQILIFQLIQVYFFTFTEIICFISGKRRKAFEKLFASCSYLIYFMTAEYTYDTVGHFLLLPVRLLRTSYILPLPLRLPTLPGSQFLPSLTGFCDDPAGMLLT